MSGVSGNGLGQNFVGALSVGFVPGPADGGEQRGIGGVVVDREIAQALNRRGAIGGLVSQQRVGLPAHGRAGIELENANQRVLAGAVGEDGQHLGALAAFVGAELAVVGQGLLNSQTVAWPNPWPAQQNLRKLGANLRRSGVHRIHQSGTDRAAQVVQLSLR